VEKKINMLETDSKDKTIIFVPIYTPSNPSRSAFSKNWR
jgi:hypothetical protein